jgi:hypothetical protein
MSRQRSAATGGFCPDSENPDVVGRRYFEMLKWKPHRPLKCASLRQHADIDLAAHVACDRVQQFRAAHDVG